MAKCCFPHTSMSSRVFPATLRFNFWDFQGTIRPTLHLGFPDGSGVALLPANAGDTGSILGLGRSPGEGNSNPLQYSCLGKPMNRGAWWAACSP